MGRPGLEAASSHFACGSMRSRCGTAASSCHTGIRGGQGSGRWRTTPLSCSVDDPALPASILSVVATAFASLYCSGLRPLFGVPSTWNAPTPAPATCTALSLTPSGPYSAITS